MRCRVVSHTQQTMAYLRQYVNGSVVSLYEIKDTLVIGRHPDCQISLDDPTVSSQHAELVVSSESAKLVDKGSTNGVRIDGEKVDTAILTEGMRFSIGTNEFEFLLAIPKDLERTLRIKKSWIPGVYFTE